MINHNCAIINLCPQISKSLQAHSCLNMSISIFVADQLLFKADEKCQLNYIQYDFCVKKCLWNIKADVTDGKFCISKPTIFGIHLMLDDQHGFFLLTPSSYFLPQHMVDN